MIKQNLLIAGYLFFHNLGLVLKFIGITLIYPWILITFTLVHLENLDVADGLWEFLRPWSYGDLGDLKEKIDSSRTSLSYGDYFFNCLSFLLWGTILLIFSPIYVPVLIHKNGKIAYEQKRTAYFRDLRLAEEASKNEELNENE